MRAIVEEGFVTPQTLPVGNGKLHDLSIYPCMNGTCSQSERSAQQACFWIHVDGYGTTPTIFVALSAGQPDVVGVLPE